MPRPFLTARWSNLCIISYAVEPSVLEPHLPPGLALDTREGQAFVSLVAFDFHDTRLWGISWPGYRNFPELNLRYYVRHGKERGVVFLREFVPQRLVAWLARLLYNEPYLAKPMLSAVRDEQDRLTADWKMSCNGRTCTISVTGCKPPFCPPDSSGEHFFKEHRWGFGTDRQGRTTRFEVEHAVWDVYPVLSHAVDLDWGEVYGPRWKFLNGRAPSSVVLAVGSAVEVYPKAVLL